MGKIEQAGITENVVDLMVGKIRNMTRFSHDRIRQAAYSLIDEDEKGEIHLKIGRVLLENTPREK